MRLLSYEDAIRQQLPPEIDKLRTQLSAFHRAEDQFSGRFLPQGVTALYLSVFMSSQNKSSK